MVFSAPVISQIGSVGGGLRGRKVGMGREVGSG